MVNPGFAEICGYPEKELLGSKSLNLVSPDYRGEVRQNAIRMLKAKSHLPYKFPIISKSGEIKWVVEKVISTVYQGQRAVLGYFLDISELKSLEGQLLQAQKMESVGRLAGGVAHDFNNMLGVILGHAELALMQVDPRSRSMPTSGDPQSRAALRRPHPPTAGLCPQADHRAQGAGPERDRGGHAQDAAAAHRRGHRSGLACRATDLWPVKMDPSQIDQILANLCVNARDAIAGVGKVTIETENVRLRRGLLRRPRRIASPASMCCWP